MSNTIGHGTVEAAPSHGSAGRGLQQLHSAHRYQRAPHVEQAEHAGTVILFDKRAYFTLPEGVAADVWALLAHARSLDELVSRLHDEYDAPREVIAADVSELLERLRRARLVKVLGMDGNPVPERRTWWRTLWRGR